MILVASGPNPPQRSKGRDTFFDIFQNRSQMVPNGVFRPPESEFLVENRFGANFHYENPKLLFADPPLLRPPNDYLTEFSIFSFQILNFPSKFFQDSIIFEVIFNTRVIKQIRQLFV